MKVRCVKIFMHLRIKFGNVIQETKNLFSSYGNTTKTRNGMG